ncbi:MAG: hypothetical protein CVV46_01945 [Spirochaetae bacterium HGW-Spirochaetae-2]|jgi:uncharacterized protein (DUF362 family)|nr:MAG: hypothetical protein CVV46_01945 [Spirochaetae bacterium HGW-Spirochaetae-2]
MQPNDIAMVYGNDPSGMTRKLLDHCGIAESLSKTAYIVLKPNLVIAATADGGATTHPEIVEAVIRYFKDHGFANISIVESAWVGDSTARAFKVHGYERLVEEYGITLVDVKKDSYTTIEAHGFAIEISDTIMDSDFLISLPVLKGHCQTTMTCALKNMKGCISDRSKRQFHSWGLHDPIAALNTVRKADLVLVDSLNGDLDFEEGGNPVQTNRMFAGRDSVLVDTFGASLMGFETSEIPYIEIAEEFGVGSTDLASANIVELNRDTTGAPYRPSGRVHELEDYTVASSACSACYGNLIHALARLDERGILSDLNQKIHIGQDYKGKTGCGLGVGICTNGFTRSVPGCPPKALDIVKFIEKHIQD